jgi:osmotically-inducible protein OsmY
MSIFDKIGNIAADAAKAVAGDASPVTTALKNAGLSTISASGQSGQVTLTGTANSSAEAEKAVNTVKSVPGVTNVVNSITVNAPATATSSKLRVNTVSSNLNIRNEPSMNGAITGKAAHNEIVTLISKDTTDWWKIRTDDGEEGYASAQYLTTA